MPLPGGLHCVCGICFKPLTEAEVKEGKYEADHWDLIFQMYICGECLQWARDHNVANMDLREGQRSHGADPRWVQQLEDDIAGLRRMVRELAADRRPAA